MNTLSDTGSRTSDDRPVIYLDHNATTPPDPRVVAAMLPFLSGAYGNPSSAHVAGRHASAAVERAREQAAALLGVMAADIVFTSGGTEANNHALRGAMEAAGGRGHIVTTNVEHPAVSEVCRHLVRLGCTWTKVPVDDTGRVTAADVIGALRPDTVIVSVMHANNETGALQPVAGIAAGLAGKGVLLHSDAAQSVGKVPLDFTALGLDLLSVAGHKLYAPKGVGMLCLRPGLDLPNLMHGAGHEDGRRPGTENVASIVGLGEACALAGETLAAEAVRLADLRDRLQAVLCARFPKARVNGPAEDRLPNTLSISFSGVTADAILAHLPDVAVSAGAACHAEGVSVSHVLQAMHVPPHLAAGTLRISLGRPTSADDTERGAVALIRAVERATTEMTPRG